MPSGIGLRGQATRILLILGRAMAGVFGGNIGANLSLAGLRDGEVQRAETIVYWQVVGGGLGGDAGIIINDAISHWKKKRKKI